LFLNFNLENGYKPRNLAGLFFAAFAAFFSGGRQSRQKKKTAAKGGKKRGGDFCGYAARKIN
jgi:hypothetical protein